MSKTVSPFDVSSPTAFTVVVDDVVVDVDVIDDALLSGAIRLTTRLKAAPATTIRFKNVEISRDNVNIYLTFILNRFNIENVELPRCLQTLGEIEIQQHRSLSSLSL